MSILVILSMCMYISMTKSNFMLAHPNGVMLHIVMCFLISQNMCWFSHSNCHGSLPVVFIK